jgi:hypothetical protein
LNSFFWLAGIPVLTHPPEKFLVSHFFVRRIRKQKNIQKSNTPFSPSPTMSQEPLQYISSPESIGKIQEIIDETNHPELASSIGADVTDPRLIYNRLTVTSVKILVPPSSNQYAEMKKELLGRAEEAAFKKPQLAEQPPLLLLDSGNMFRQWLSEEKYLVRWDPIGETFLFSIGEPVQQEGIAGKGIYFAECAGKADQIATEDEKRECTIVMCRVILGNVLAIPFVSKLEPQMIPQIINLNESHSALIPPSSTTAAEPHRFRTFVSYDPKLVYPQYLITYRREFVPSHLVILRHPRKNNKELLTEELFQLINDAVPGKKKLNPLTSSRFLLHSRAWHLELDEKNFKEQLTKLVVALDIKFITPEQIEKWDWSKVYQPKTLKEATLIFCPPRTRHVLPLVHSIPLGVYLIDGKGQKGIIVTLENGVPRTNVNCMIAPYRLYRTSGEVQVIYKDRLLLVKNGSFSKVDLPGWTVGTLERATIDDSVGVKETLDNTTGSLIPFRRFLDKKRMRLEPLPSISRSRFMGAKKAVLFQVDETTGLTVLAIYEALRLDSEDLNLMFWDSTIFCLYKQLAIIIVASARTELRTNNNNNSPKTIETFNLDTWVPDTVRRVTLKGDNIKTVKLPEPDKTPYDTKVSFPLHNHKEALETLFQFYTSNLPDHPDVVACLTLEPHESLVESTEIEMRLRTLYVQYVALWFEPENNSSSATENQGSAKTKVQVVASLGIVWNMLAQIYSNPNADVFPLAKFETFRIEKFERPDPQRYAAPLDPTQLFMHVYNPHRNKFRLVRQFQHHFNGLVPPEIISLAASFLPVHWCTIEMFELYLHFGRVLSPREFLDKKPVMFAIALEAGYKVESEHSVFGELAMRIYHENFKDYVFAQEPKDIYEPINKILDTLEGEKELFARKFHLKLQPCVRWQKIAYSVYGVVELSKEAVDPIPNPWLPQTSEAKGKIHPEHHRVPGTMGPNFIPQYLKNLVIRREQLIALVFDSQVSRRPDFFMTPLSREAFTVRDPEATQIPYVNWKGESGFEDTFMHPIALQTDLALGATLHSIFPSLVHDKQKVLEKYSQLRSHCAIQAWIPSVTLKSATILSCLNLPEGVKELRTIKCAPKDMTSELLKLATKGQMRNEYVAAAKPEQPIRLPYFTGINLASTNYKPEGHIYFKTQPHFRVALHSDTGKKFFASCDEMYFRIQATSGDITIKDALMPLNRGDSLFREYKISWTSTHISFVKLSTGTRMSFAFKDLYMSSFSYNLLILEQGHFEGIYFSKEDSGEYFDF